MSSMISAGVGERQPNAQGDVKTIQSLLNRNLTWIVPTKSLVSDGRCGPATVAAIKAFQGRVMQLSEPDGIVRPNGPTLRCLTGHVASLGKAPAKEKHESGGGLTGAEYVEAARLLNCEQAAIKAVAQTETRRSAFDEKGRPTILFERHIFHARTKGKFDREHPELSNKSSGGYGLFSAQYGRLEKAIALDKKAALESASWGAFQIMGFNHSAAGYPASVESFVDAMKSSERNHLSAFVAFVKADKALLKAIQKKDWRTFARKYNGPKYADNQYDTNMKTNYEQIKRDESKLSGTFSNQTSIK